MGMSFLLVILVPLAILFFWNASIVSKRNRAQEALSGIDVQLKQRSSLIPNVLKIAQKFMDHETALMKEITELRTKAEKDYDPADKEAVREHFAAAQQLGGKMGQLMVAVENYPNLKSDQTMVQAMQTYNEVEAQITAARRFYNSSVTALNNSVQIFPGNLIAGFSSISAMPFYEGDEASRAPVNADDYLR